MKKGRKKKPKKYKCKVCPAYYEKQNSLQQWCSPSCGFKYSQKMLKKKEDEERKRVKRDLSKRKELIKGKGQLTKEAQREFNRWIVQRDWFDKCICCGRDNTKEYIGSTAWNAGHYLSVGAYPEKRFNPDNVHKQLAYCNKYLQGDGGSYRENLIRKIGLKRVLKLESPEPPKKYTHDELREIRDYYRKEANILKKQNMEKMECK